MKKHTYNIRHLCLISLFSALIVIMAQISIPMPIGVPITMQTFAVTIAGIILGSKKGFTATLIYILLGAIGLPVFANFTGGWQSITGPTSGFILSFPLMAYIIGLGTEHRQKFRFCYSLGIALGTILNMLCGILMFCVVTKSPLTVGFATCGLPYIPVTVIKAIAAAISGIQIRKRCYQFLQ